MKASIYSIITALFISLCACEKPYSPEKEKNKKETTIDSEDEKEEEKSSDDEKKIKKNLRTTLPLQKNLILTKKRKVLHLTIHQTTSPITAIQFLKKTTFQYLIS